MAVFNKKLFDIDNGSEWNLLGFSETEPSINFDEKHYFPSLSKVHNSLAAALVTRVISVCIPCFNEESNALKRTIDSLIAQKMPPHCSLEILVVMDGVHKMSESMKAYVSSILGLSLPADNGLMPTDISDKSTNHLSTIFQDDVETIIVEPINEMNKKHSISLIIKKNNHRKVNSQIWWLGGHAKACNAEFVLTTDCGIVFESSLLKLLIERLDNDQKLAAVTGFQRMMTAEMEGDQPNEWLRDPFGYMLRQIQRFI